MENNQNNEIENEVKNEVNNKIENEVDNKIENKIENNIENKIEKKVDNKIEKKVKPKPAHIKECDICCCDYNSKIKYRSIKCIKCQYEACFKCYEIYMTELAVNESCYPMCMKCRFTWDYNFMLKNTPLTFRSKLAKLREEVLYNLNRSLFPSYSEKYLLTFSISQLTANTYDETYNIKILNYLNMRPIFAYKENMEVFVKYGGKVKKLLLSEKNFNIRKLQKEFHTLRLDAWYVLKDTINNKKKEEIVPVHNRPCKKDGCVGYLSEKWLCYTCNTKFCRRCQEIKNEKHVCNEAVLETVKSLKKDSVECPKCFVFIYKISGCFQMWCTNCNTAFDWKTRKILNTKNFHNPHYIEYVRSKNNNNNNDPANLTCEDTLKFISQGHKGATELRNHLNELYGLFRHASENVESKKFDIILLALKYLNKNITLEQYKKRSQILDKKIKKLQEIQDINEVFKLQTVEIFNNMICETPLEDIVLLIVELINTNNKYRLEIANQYKNSVDVISYANHEPYNLIYGSKNLVKFSMEPYREGKKNIACSQCNNYYNIMQVLDTINNMEYKQKLIYLGFDNARFRDERYTCIHCFEKKTE